MSCTLWVIKHNWDFTPLYQNVIYRRNFTNTDKYIEFNYYLHQDSSTPYELRSRLTSVTALESEEKIMDRWNMNFSMLEIKMRFQVVFKNDQASNETLISCYLNYYADINGTEESFDKALTQDVGVFLSFYDEHFSSFNDQENESVFAYVQVLLEEIMFFQGNPPTSFRTIYENDPAIWEDIILSSKKGRI